ncbi:cytochrome-c oxidase, cbb3-type subunit III [Dokdonella sp.]|uniref:cytochrome-c oxidase, cbb3-type subunit III n=1 Tax=Dokdonella sp. TaxID=2291710 RepID=UPI0031C8A740|nr:cytochrome-c oxidase, cbb3-type subunit III [Dokdonella sp.]
MNGFWSAWIMFLVVFNLGLTFFLYIWGQRVRIATLPDGTTGHVWAHGVLREGLRKLPLWWVLLSAAMFIAAFIYLVLYPGFGASEGALGWTSHKEVQADLEANRARLAGLLQQLDTGSVEQLAGNAEATAYGQRLFIDNCAACHGRAGHGNQVIGAPDLTDGKWLYGGDGATLMASIQDGRQGTMPPFGSTFDADGVANLANYVLSLSGAAHSPTRAAAGKDNFTVCSACHGVDGKGNQTLGAPDLSDSVWLYGGDLASIETTIREGRSGVMPAWRARLPEHDIRAIAAWVYAQSAHEAGASSAGGGAP